MTLYLTKRGLDFTPNDTETEGSDIGNYRVFVRYINLDGAEIVGDFVRRDLREERTEKNGKTRTVVTSTIGLGQSLQIENWKGCWRYAISSDRPRLYTRADILDLVNSDSADDYDGVEIVDQSAETVPVYSPAAQELHRQYEAEQHAALVEHLKTWTADNFKQWINDTCDYKRLTPDEYRAVTLIAFERAAEEYGIIHDEPGIDGPGPKRGAYTWMVFARHLFEEQTYIDPYEDPEFLARVVELAPWYTGRYIRTVTPDEFAAMVAELDDPAVKLGKALRRALLAAVAVKNDPEGDGGTSNFDAPALDFAEMGLKKAQAEQVIRQAGLMCYDWMLGRNRRVNGKLVKAPVYLVINGFQCGQGFCRTRMSEAFCSSLKADGVPAGMYYQMD